MKILYFGPLKKEANFFKLVTIIELLSNDMFRVPNQT